MTYWSERKLLLERALSMIKFEPNKHETQSIIRWSTDRNQTDSVSRINCLTFVTLF